MTKFSKVAKPVVLSKEDRKVQDYINNQRYTTSEAVWANGSYKGFTIQKAATNPNNQIKGDQHKPALDSIFESVKWTCAKYSKALVLRYDLFPAHKSLDISKFHKDLVERLKKVKFNKDGAFVSGDKQKGQSVYGSPDYLWVREIGSSLYNQGEHYHGAIFCKKLQGVSIPQILDNFREIATHCIRLQLLKLLKKAKPDTYNYRVIEESLNELTAMADKDSQLESPYLNTAGYFILERSMLKKELAKGQKDEIDRLLKSGEGHKYLYIEKIKSRKHNKNKAIGGILEECIYALSYMSKIASKTHADFPDDPRRFSQSNKKLTVKESPYHPDIKDKLDQVEAIFEEYNC